MRKVDVIVHPFRLRILLALAGEELTTQEIAEAMPDVPVSSLYRHVKLLLDEEIIAVADTRLVKSVQEKVYRVAQSTFLSPADLTGLSPDEHMQFFTNYVLTLLQGFQAYLEQATSDGGNVDMLADRVGYTEVLFWASDAEFDAFTVALNQAIRPHLVHKKAPGRRKRKLATITFPVD